MLCYLNLIEDPIKQASFEQLYYAHRDLMRHVAYEVLHDSALAEDAVHEAFLRIAQNFHKMDDPLSHKTKAFVVIIVKNQAINLYNKRKHRAEFAWQDWEEPEDPSTQEEGNRVLDAIKRLPEMYAHALTLEFVYGYSEKECAKLLSIKPATFRKRIERGRTMLAEELEKEGIGGYV